MIESIGVLSVDRFNLTLAIGHRETDKGQYDGLNELGACSGGAMADIQRTYFFS